MISNNQKQSFILLYVALGKQDNPTYDPRNKYFVGANAFQEFLSKMRGISLEKQDKRRGTIELDIPDKNKKNIAFALGSTKREAEKELNRSFPQALDQLQKLYCYIELKGDLTDVFVNYKSFKSSSLFALAVNMHQGDTITPLPQNDSSQMTKTFFELKTQIIADLNKSTEKSGSTFGFLKSMSAFFQCCYGNSNNIDDSKENLVENEQQQKEFLQENLFSKINNAQDLTSLFTVLSDFYRNNQAQYTKVTDAISDVLAGAEFATVRPSSTPTVGLNNNNNN